MPERNTIDATALRLLLDYDPLTGVFRWREDSYSFGVGSHRAGDVAGQPDEKGYVRISVGGQTLMAHRLAWIYMTGDCPEQVDHKDLDKANNRWPNLRAASNGLNKANSPRRRDNTTGFKGVYDRGNGRYRAAIRVEGKLIILGHFSDPAEAHAAYVAAARQHFGEFARAS